MENEIDSMLVARAHKFSFGTQLGKVGQRQRRKKQSTNSRKSICMCFFPKSYAEIVESVMLTCVDANSFVPKVTQSNSIEYEINETKQNIH